MFLYMFWGQLSVYWCIFRRTTNVHVSFCSCDWFLVCDASETKLSLDICTKRDFFLLRHQTTCSMYTKWKRKKRFLVHFMFKCRVKSTNPHNGRVRGETTCATSRGGKPLLKPNYYTSFSQIILTESMNGRKRDWLSKNRWMRTGVSHLLELETVCIAFAAVATNRFRISSPLPLLVPARPSSRLRPNEAELWVASRTQREVGRHHLRLLLLQAPSEVLRSRRTRPPPGMGSFQLCHPVLLPTWKTVFVRWMSLKSF